MKFQLVWKFIFCETGESYISYFFFGEWNIAEIIHKIFDVESKPNCIQGIKTESMKWNDLKTKIFPAQIFIKMMKIHHLSIILAPCIHKKKGSMLNCPFIIVYFSPLIQFNLFLLFSRAVDAIFISKKKYIIQIYDPTIWKFFILFHYFPFLLWYVLHIKKKCFIKKNHIKFIMYLMVGRTAPLLVNSEWIFNNSKSSLWWKI